MKILDIKLVPQFCLGFSSQFPDLELTDLVAGCLPRPGHVPVYLKKQINHGLVVILVSRLASLYCIFIYLGRH